jgi:hypothetical protein
MRRTSFASTRPANLKKTANQLIEFCVNEFKKKSSKAQISRTLMITFLQHNFFAEWRLGASICLAGVEWLWDKGSALFAKFIKLQSHPPYQN